MLLEKLPALKVKFKELEDKLSDPELMANNRKYAKIAREHNDLSHVLEVFHSYEELMTSIDEGESILRGDDDDLKEIVREEFDDSLAEKAKLEDDLKILLIPKDPLDQGAAILEIRAGAGGDEAALFASDLVRMYLRYTEANNWKHEFITLNELGGGGTKEAIIEVTGADAYGTLKFESGVHRVQRIPQTESSGRIHTSAATVAVLPEAEEVDVEINAGDLRIDTFRASGAGGQHVNKTESAVRITHLPTSTVVQCQDGRSQHANKDQAMKQLKSKLYELEMQKRNSEKQDVEDLKSDIGWGHQIRSYVLDQSRIKDLRTGVESSNTQDVLDGNLDQFIVASLKAGL